MKSKVDIEKKENQLSELMSKITKKPLEPIYEDLNSIKTLTESFESSLNEVNEKLDFLSDHDELLEKVTKSLLRIQSNLSDDISESFENNNAKFTEVINCILEAREDLSTLSNDFADKSSLTIKSLDFLSIETKENKAKLLKSVAELELSIDKKIKNSESIVMKRLSDISEIQNLYIDSYKKNIECTNKKFIKLVMLCSIPLFLCLVLLILILFKVV